MIYQDDGILVYVNAPPLTPTQPTHFGGVVYGCVFSSVFCFYFCSVIKTATPH